eukprot:jgi/Galph1/2106/GphlegSOOS_G820.1
MVAWSRGSLLPCQRLINTSKLLYRNLCASSIDTSKEFDTDTFASTVSSPEESKSTSGFPGNETHEKKFEDTFSGQRNRPGVQPISTPVGTFNKQQVIPNEIHVSHLPQNMTRPEIAQHFSRFGEITALTVTSTGLQEKNVYAVIRFKDVGCCDQALSLDGKLLGNKTISVRRNMNALFLARMHERLRGIRRRNKESNES